LRTRQIKNFLALTLLSVGTPMLLAGDEMRHSQQGNNKAYCRNDELFSFDYPAPTIRRGLSLYQADDRVPTESKVVDRAL
jgi:isoamylase